MSLSCFARARAARADAAAVRPGAMRRPALRPGPLLAIVLTLASAATPRASAASACSVAASGRPTAKGFACEVALDPSATLHWTVGPAPATDGVAAVAADDASFAVVADAASGVVGLSFQSGPVMIPARAVMSTVDAAGANADVAAYALNVYNAAGVAADATFALSSAAVAVEAGVTTLAFVAAKSTVGLERFRGASTLRRVTGPHTTAFARRAPFLEDSRRRLSASTPRFQSLRASTPPRGSD